MQGILSGLGRRWRGGEVRWTRPPPPAWAEVARAVVSDDDEGACARVCLCVCGQCVTGGVLGHAWVQGKLHRSRGRGICGRGASEHDEPDVSPPGVSDEPFQSEDAFFGDTLRGGSCRWNSLGADGAASVAEALRDTTGLKTLYLE